MSADKTNIYLYTDGAAKGNPGRGGYGALLIFGKHKKELSKGFVETTNNRMELLAVIAGLEALNTTEHPVAIYSDSKYVVDAINKGWLRKWAMTGFKKKKIKEGSKTLQMAWTKFSKERSNRKIFRNHKTK